jgi:hypothetical protein
MKQTKFLYGKDARDKKTFSGQWWDISPEASPRWDALGQPRSEASRPIIQLCRFRQVTRQAITNNHSWAPMVKKTSIGSIPIID